MRLLHLVPRYYPVIGGAENHMRALSERFAACGHEVTVATSDALDVSLLWQPGMRRLTTNREVHNGVRVLRFPVRHFLNSRLAFPAFHRLLWLLSKLRLPPLALLRLTAQAIPYMPALQQWLQSTSERFDIVASMGLPYDALMLGGRRLARRSAAPFVCYPLTHFGAGIRPGSEHESQFYTMRHQIDMITHSDGLVAQTETEAQFYQQHGLEPQRVLVAGPGIDPASLGGGDGDRLRAQHNIDGPIVLYLGMLARSKGAIDTVEAMRRLWRQQVDATLLLIGSAADEFESFWLRLAATEKKRIVRLGRVDEQTKRDALAACRLLSMPSRMDSFGIAYLEAGFYGKPVIAARCWGVTDVVRHDLNGLIVPYGDDEQLARAIGNLLADPQLCARLGSHGRALTLQHHTWQHKYDIVESFYRRLLTLQASKGNLIGGE